MQSAMKEYTKIYERKGFSNLSAWEVMKDHLKWSPVPRGGGEIGQSTKRSKTSETGQFSSSNEGPPLTEEATPRQPQRKGKRSVESSSSTGQNELVDAVKEFKMMREVEIEKKMRDREELRTARLEKERSVKAMMEKQMAMFEAQKEVLQQEQFDRDVETFTKPHDHLQHPYLQIKLAQKRKIAEKYGWDCPF